MAADNLYIGTPLGKDKSGFAEVPIRTNKIAVCAIVKNEAENIIEWIAYYRVLGVDEFYLYDNFSTDNIVDILGPMIRNGIVHLVSWPFKPGQIEAYDDFSRRFGRKFEWAVFVDADEYVHLLQERSLKNYLSKFKAYSCVALQWLNFGPSGHVERPEGLFIENYDMRLPDDDYPAHGHVKSIVKMADYIGAVDPHSFDVKGDIVNEYGDKVTFTDSEKHYSIQPILVHRESCINHYYTRSEADWRKKVGRGFADHPEGGAASRPDHILDYMRARAIVRDERIKKFSDLVKQEIEALRVG